jgi:ankyrin repeat-rich membrane spanning protein
LLKAVRKRNLDLVQILIENGAKVSACDRKGDNALHISVRGRSKRITESLLRNPKNARLLYNKNKNSETAYEIDATHDRSVLTQVFGARNLNSDDNLQGYELFSSAIADVLSEPSLRTPITVGLFARWGSGKSFLLSRLRKEMETFAMYTAEIWFEFSILQFAISFTPGGVIITMLLGIAGSLVAGFVGRSFGWYSSGTSGAGIIASIIGAMALLGIYRLLLRRRHTTTGGRTV